MVKAFTRKCRSDFDFEDLVSLLKKLGFEFRIKGSHHIFFKEGIDEIITSI
ncbi:type II toxin-antitoxin system HicA family toxin [Ohtaekwangia sp.]|uniref:type II toxin-antitoxin system HicA family toxin n=1 Tax=Ohtaekwangia sp. TaxID=2066019 RepID=UPI003FA59176